MLFNHLLLLCVNIIYFRKAISLLPQHESYTGDFLHTIQQADQHVWSYSYLTYAAGETIDYKTGQGLSGHADLGTLINRYAHPQQKKIKALSQTMHSILNVGQSGTT